MSRKEAHELLDKLFDMKFTGFFGLNFFCGGVTHDELKLSSKQFLNIV